MGKDASPSKYALLGFLSLRPMSGYDIKKTVEQSIAYFWNESYGQIYPLLKKLAGEGLAIRRTEKNSGKPDRLVYSITDRGREELRRWLARAPQTQPPRSELLLKLFFSSPQDLAANLSHVEEMRATHRAALTEYDRVEQQLRRQHGRHPRLAFWMLTLDFGRRRSLAIVRWCDATHRALRGMRSHSRSSKPKGAVS